MSVPPVRCLHLQWLEVMLASMAVATPLLISDKGSITATQGSGSKVVSFDGKTHVVWQEHRDEGFLNFIRSLDRTSGDLTEPSLLNQGVDDHARPVLVADSQGFLHAVLSGHNSPMAYRRSLVPNDASGWTDEIAVGAGTYPVLVCAPDDTLYLTVRNADGWNGVDLFVKAATEDWCPAPKPVRRTDAYAGYATYTNGFGVTSDGCLHTVWDFFETQGGDPQYGLQEATGYMCSRDRALTWQRLDGSPIDGAARPENMDLFITHQESFEAINPGSRISANGAIALDAAEHPVILYVSHASHPGELTAAVTDVNGGWRLETVDIIERTWPDMRCGRLERSTTRTPDGTVCLLLELFPLSEGWDDDGRPTGFHGNPDSPGKKLVWLSTADGGRSWSVEMALPDGRFFNRSNVERATSARGAAADKWPAFIFHDGPTRGRGDEVIQVNVYLVTSD